MMTKILNGIFNVTKYLLFIAAFGITIFIVIQMNSRLEKGFMTSINVFIPFFVLLGLFVVNLIFHQKGISQNIFYNITCNLVFLTILYVGYRAFADKNMVLNQKYGYGIDFNYFNSFLAYLKIMLYGLCIGNVFFMFQPREKKETKKLKKETEVLE